MRKRKRKSGLLPYTAGLVVGYAAALLVCIPAALVLSLTDVAASTAGAAAVLAMSVGSFMGGRTAGIIKRKDGLKTGALYGMIFVLPLLILSAVFTRSWSGMFFVKLILCVAFAAVGGVAGVNREE